MGEHKIVSDYNEDFFKDIIEEDKFFEALGDKAPKGLEKELDIMVRVHNEIAETLVRPRFDVEFQTIRTLMEPNTQETKDELQLSKVKVKFRRVLLDVIRRQIIKKVKGDVAEE